METLTPHHAKTRLETALDIHSVLFILTWGVADTVTTFAASAAVGPGGESNPIVRMALETHPAAVIVAKSVSLIVILAMWNAGRDHIQSAPGWWVWAYSAHAAVLSASAMNVAVVLTA